MAYMSPNRAVGAVWQRRRAPGHAYRRRGSLRRWRHDVVHVEPEVRGGGGGGGGERHRDNYQLELHGTKLAFGHGVIRERRTKGLLLEPWNTACAYIIRRSTTRVRGCTSLLE